MPSTVLLWLIRPVPSHQIIIMYLIHSKQKSPIDLSHVRRYPSTMPELPLFKPKRRHVRTTGKRAEQRRKAAMRDPARLNPTVFSANKASEWQLALEYQNSFTKLIPLLEKYQHCPSEEKVWRMADLTRSFALEYARIQRFLMFRPDPPKKLQKYSQLIADFEIAYKESLIPESEKIKRDILDEKIEQHNNIRFLEFQREKLKQESDPVIYAKYKRLHERQEQMLRKNLGLQYWEKTPPRSLEEVEAKIAELKASPMVRVDDPPMLYRNLTSPALNRSYQNPKIDRRRIPGTEHRLNPRKPHWDVIGAFDKIVASYNNEAEALAILDKNPDLGLTLRYRGPSLQENIGNKKIPKYLVKEEYTVFDADKNIVRKTKSFIQARSLVYDNRDKGYTMTPETEFNRRGRRRKIQGE